MKKVKDFIIQEIPNNSTVIVACSGGPDSMCLLTLMCQLKKEYNWHVVVAHVNHKIRIESDDEEQFVKSFAINNNLDIEIEHFDEFKNDKFSEEKARNKRYEFFYKVCQKYHAKYLLTAHHGDDLIETILMRITRGSNLKGYMGIRSKSKYKDLVILRPLLSINKDKILDFNKKENILYVIDKSNMSNEYTRNRYRNVILPFLKKEEDKINDKYRQFSDELSNYNDFVNEYIIKNEFIVDNKLVINKIKNETDFLKKKCIELIIRNIQDQDYLAITNKQVDNILGILSSGNKTIDLNNGYKCIKDYEYLQIVKTSNESTNKAYHFTLDDRVDYNNWAIFKVAECDKDTNYEVRLNSKEIKLPLIVRNRCSGDRIEIKNLKGSKKVKDIFIDEKVNLSDRETIPIVTDSNNVILWIPGIKKSKFTKDKQENYDIILKYEVKINERKN